MSRWGMRLFEGDQDMDIVIEIDSTFGEDKNSLGLTQMVHQTDMLVPMEARIYYQTEEYQKELTEIVAKARVKLDSGDMGQKLISHWRAKESDHDGKYNVIIVGALLMRAGAKIDESELQHLRELVPCINCNQVYTLPCGDEGFRGPGKAQFLAALDNYQPGVPRSYQELSCFYCGKIEADLGKAPSKCGGCDAAWYCGKDCQKAHWKHHKSSCTCSSGCANM